MEAAKVHVRAAVAVHISDCHARTIVGDRIGKVSVTRQAIGERHPSDGRIHQGESRPLARDRRQGRGTHLSLSSRQCQSSGGHKETQDQPMEDLAGWTHSSRSVNGHGGAERLVETEEAFNAASATESPPAARCPTKRPDSHGGRGRRRAIR